MTVRDAILNVLLNADRPLRQVDIAHRGWLVNSSVRRECQKLEKQGEIDVQGFDGGKPTFILAPHVRERLTPRVVEQVATDTDSAIELVKMSQ